MNVHLIYPDADYFGAGLKQIEQDLALMDVDRKNRAIPADTLIEGWYYPDDGKREPVFTDIAPLGDATTPLLRCPRTDVLRPMLRSVGTILPMTPWRGECFEAFVCDTQLDAADPDRTERCHEDHEFFGNKIRRYAFHAAPLRDATVFRVRGLPGRLFATDRFIDLARDNGLLGLQVLPLWSSETGPIGVIEDPMIEFERFPPGFGSTPKEKRARMQALLDARDRVDGECGPPA